MSDETVRVSVETADELFPVLSISRTFYTESPGSYEVPAALWEALQSAEQAVYRAKVAVMRYLAEHQEPSFASWVAKHGAD